MRKYTVKLSVSQLAAMVNITAHISVELKKEGDVLLSLLFSELNALALEKCNTVKETGKLKLTPSQSWACMRGLNDFDFTDYYLENTSRYIIEQIQKQYINGNFDT